MVAESFDLFRDNERVSLLYRIRDLKIKQNDLVILKGPNASGKTMLINYLTGNIDPDFGVGTIEIAKDIENYSFLTYPVLIVEGSFQENLLGINPIEELIRILNIDFSDKIITTNPINLSYGQQQKLNLLRTLSKKSQYLFLDEPFTNLDQETQDNLIHYLQKIKGTKTIVIIMHDKVLDPYADRIFTIENQSITQSHALNL